MPTHKLQVTPINSPYFIKVFPYLNCDVSSIVSIPTPKSFQIPNSKYEPNVNQFLSFHVLQPITLKMVYNSSKFLEQITQAHDATTKKPSTKIRRWKHQITVFL